MARRGSRLDAGTIPGAVHKLGTYGSINHDLVQACRTEAEVVLAFLPSGKPVGVLKGINLVEGVLATGTGRTYRFIKVEVVSRDQAEALRQVLADATRTIH